MASTILEMMKLEKAVASFAALAHETRLGVFRLLVGAGPEGASASAIAEALGVAPTALSFHLSHLSAAGLVHARREGRWTYYSADFARMRELIDYLLEDCCRGALVAGGKRAAKNRRNC
jgi:ArsR family transcriptional regulator